MKNSNAHVSETVRDSDFFPKLRAAVILGDSFKIKAWQLAALRECTGLLDVELVLSCRNTKIKRRLFRNLLYFLINYICLKNNQTKKMTYRPQDAEVISFDSVYNRNWQSLPTEILQKIESKNIDVIIKFGMNLLVIPEPLSAKFGVLSFHHGDPQKYRGRPAGFYEILHNAGSVGITVQKLSNKLDGGAICVSAASKLYSWSYKKTAQNFYRNSIPLLRKAILNISVGNIRTNGAEGKNYKLPGNLTALYFLLLLLKRKIGHLLYGAFFEKNWNVLLSEHIHLNFDGANDEIIKSESGRVASVDPSYNFYADPFFSANGSEIYVEAMNKKNNLGEIVALDERSLLLKRTIFKAKHCSYPQPLLMDRVECLLPEISSYSSPRLIYSDDPNRFFILKGLEKYRLVDATYFFHNGFHFIFASESDRSSDNLKLFVSNTVLGPYSEHPANPIVIDPSCARMAGAILLRWGKLLRFGQDNSFGYGSKISICEIFDLSPTAYHEIKIKQISFDGEAWGPHTINFYNDKFVVDFYFNRFSPFSGYRRLISKLYKK